MEQDRNLRTVTRLLGIALIFMGFVNNLLAITGSYELDPFTGVTFMVGIMLFVFGAGRTWHRWVVIGLAATLGLAFIIRGEIGGKTQLAMFWGTLLVVLFYSFFVKESKSDEDPPGKGAGTGD